MSRVFTFSKVLMGGVALQLLMCSPALADSDAEVPSDTVAAQQAGQGAWNYEAVQGFDANLLNMQERLAALGYYPTYLVDGYYKPQLKQSVMDFQRDYGLRSDGVFSDETAMKLNEYTGMSRMAPAPAPLPIHWNLAPGGYVGR